MGNARHITHAAAVGLVVLGLLAAATQAVALRSNARPETTSTTLEVPAAKAKKPALRLTTRTPKVTAGRSVAFRIATNTKHRRTVSVQRWDPKGRTWRKVATRKVSAAATVRVKVTAGSWRFRAKTAKLRHRTGGKTHTHAATRSATVTIKAKAKAPAVPTKPATLSADEKTLLAAVRAARASYSPFDNTALDSEGGDSCLTTYARAHSAWMAGLGRAADPGSAAHRAAKRATPVAACGGLTVTAVTRAVGAASSAPDAAAAAVRAWLATPYGETDRLLSTCHEASSFRFGVAAPSKDSARWLTVLVASPTADTKKSGLC